MIYLAATLFVGYCALHVLAFLLEILVPPKR